MVTVLKETERFKYIRENILQFTAIFDKVSGKRTIWSEKHNNNLIEFNNEDFNKCCESLEYI